LQNPVEKGTRQPENAEEEERGRQAVGEVLRQGFHGRPGHFLPGEVFGLPAHQVPGELSPGPRKVVPLEGVKDPFSRLEKARKGECGLEQRDGEDGEEKVGEHAEDPGRPGKEKAAGEHKRAAEIEQRPLPPRGAVLPEGGDVFPHVDHGMVFRRRLADEEVPHRRPQEDENKHHGLSFLSSVFGPPGTREWNLPSHPGESRRTAVSRISPLRVSAPEGRRMP
jgi:hypothetical protein